FALLYDVIEQGQFFLRRANGLLGRIQVRERIDADFIPLMAISIDAHAALMLPEVQAVETNRQRVGPHIFAAHIDAQSDTSRGGHERANREALIGLNAATRL